MSVKAIGMVFKAAAKSRIEVPLRVSNADVVVPGHSFQCGSRSTLAVVVCAWVNRLLEQLWRPRQLRDRSVTVVTANAPVESVLRVIKHLLRCLEQAELHVELRSRVDE